MYRYLLVVIIAFFASVLVTIRADNEFCGCQYNLPSVYITMPPPWRQARHTSATQCNSVCYSATNPTPAVAGRTNYRHAAGSHPFSTPISYAAHTLSLCPISSGPDRCTTRQTELAFAPIGTKESLGKWTEMIADRLVRHFAHRYPFGSGQRSGNEDACTDNTNWDNRYGYVILETACMLRFCYTGSYKPPLSNTPGAMPRHLKAYQ